MDISYPRCKTPEGSGKPRLVDINGRSLLWAPLVPKARSRFHGRTVTKEPQGALKSSKQPDSKPKPIQSCISRNPRAGRENIGITVNGRDFVWVPPISRFPQESQETQVSRLPNSISDQELQSAPKSSKQTDDEVDSE
uniref:Uncharacterized protein n=1 Tax=Steinernema glaseri TaxID=37863 RepID=A0A1I7XYU9_9BILA